MSRKYLAGIDIGTTGAKTAIFDLEGNIIGSGYREYTCTYPKPNWVEQDVTIVLNATLESAKEAVLNANVEPNQIQSIGLSSQRCCSIFVDENGEPMKMISWQDNRTTKEVEQISKLISPADFYKKTGLPLNTTWILTKILWVQNNEPSVWNKTKKVLQLQDYVLKSLGAEDYYVDMPDVSLYGLWDTDSFKWDNELLKLFGINDSMLPKPMKSGTKVGTISKKASAKTGFLEGTPICVGAGDQNSASVGAGIIEEGMASISIGTGGMAIAYLDKPYRDPTGNSMVTNHAKYGSWQLEGYQAGAAGVFRWFKDQIAVIESAYADSMSKDPFVLLDEEIASAPIGAKGLVFLPYLASATSPRWNSNARGTLIGLTFSHDRACIARAFMEGITLEQKDIVKTMLNTGVRINKIRAMGGATNSVLWNQMQADMYNMKVETLKVKDAALLGAAIFGGVGVGVFDDIEEGVNKMVQVENAYLPILENVKIYDELYEVYCAAYEGLTEKQAFDKIAALQEKY